MKTDQQIDRYLQHLGFQKLNNIQERMLLEARNHHHIVLQAPTGSGKTVAFLLPSIGKIKSTLQAVQLLIVVPSRELALQIDQVARSFGSGLKIVTCYGGHPMKSELNSLIEPPQILIGTPGRIAAHMKRGSFETIHIQSIVLDEFDKSLEFGFEKEMTAILKQLTKLKYKILTSATQAIEVPAFVGIKNPAHVNFQPVQAVEKRAHRIVRSIEKDKLTALLQLLCEIGHEGTLVFCNHREAVERISTLLNERWIVHDIFHGGLEQQDRERALIKFRNGSTRILLSTDLASRGLDIPEIKNIVHYQVATTESAYIHRNGRTARMHAEGTVWHILAEDESLSDFIKEDATLHQTNAEAPLPPTTEWRTLFIGGGKKDKISKVDIVGFLIHKGELNKEEIGLITIFDNQAFVAIKGDKIQRTVKILRKEKIKNKKVKIDISA